ncbi:MAG: hypothetical protein VYC34_04705, partial [Planctomycetota bacterium]|nr:hypothetical protein [Planctomycetota bacterium]
MTSALAPLLLACCLAAAPHAQSPEPLGAQPTDPRQIIGAVAVWSDDSGDAQQRPDGDSAPLVPYGGALPDVRRIRLSGWSAANPATAPFVGSPVAAASANLFRLDVVFEGLLNPPGSLGVGGRPFAPFQFGPNPLYGTVEIDVDDDPNTGGLLGAAAEDGYLANAGRFAGIPNSLLRPRAPRWGDQIDAVFNTSPQFERSGGEFVLTFCGCFDVTLISGDDNGDGEFGEDEQWIVQGRFFQRVNGFVEVSNAFGGSEPGWYDPPVRLQFTHTPDQDGLDDGETEVSLVFALNMQGAAMLAGQNVQSPNFNVGDHVSVEEALLELIASLGLNPPAGPSLTLAAGWQSKNVLDHLDPTAWEVNFIFSVPYGVSNMQSFIHTDVGFRQRPFDVNGDGVV